MKLKMEIIEDWIENFMGLLGVLIGLVIVLSIAAIILRVAIKVWTQ